MILLAKYLLVIIFICLAGLHFYWALAGRWGLDRAIPTDPATLKPLFRPGSFICFIVGLCLFCIAVYILDPGHRISHEISKSWYHRGLAFLSVLFALRALGDFRYVGYFKKIRQTPFARADTAYFTPFCLFVTIVLAFLLAAN
jgi:hypothetical protein